MMLTNLKNFITKFKKWIIGFLIGGTALAAGLGAITTSETILSTDITEAYTTKNISVFKNLQTGEIKEVEITDIENNNLSQKDAGQPYLSGYKWLYTTGGVRVATTTLMDYQYYEAGTDVASSTLIMIKIPNKNAQLIKKDCLINNKLTQQCLNLIQ